MSRYIPDSLRLLVAKRAGFSCKYCLLPERYSFFPFQIDHITSLKHGGATEQDNLAYACTLCNRNKGSDLGTRLVKNGPLIPFFNPRMEHWSDHFKIERDGFIQAMTPIWGCDYKNLRSQSPR